MNVLSLFDETIDEILKNYKDNKLEKYDLSPKPQGLRMA